MSRSTINIKKRTIQPDPLYGNRVVAKLINQVMRDGKKNAAIKSIYQAFDILAKKVKDQEPIEIFRQALENIKPNLEVRSRRVGGAAYQVPVPVKGARRESLAIRWLIAFARKRPNKEFHTFAQKIAAEILDAYHNQGESIRKKELTHKMADANKAFAHFRW